MECRRRAFAGRGSRIGPGGAGKTSLGALLAECRPCVAALSSGFMTYAQDVHPEYPRLRRDVEHNPKTFALIPSFDLEASVAETLRRQRERPFARSAEKEEAVIRERLPIYLGLQARTIETMRPRAEIVDEVVEIVGRAGGPIPTAYR